LKSKEIFSTPNQLLFLKKGFVGFVVHVTSNALWLISPLAAQ
jgi:hypothetical protein